MDCRKWYDRYSTDCRLKYPSEMTQKTYRSCVGVFLSFFEKYREPKEIPTDQIKSWLLKTDSFASRNHRLCAIKSFYEITVGMPLKLDKIPFAKKEKRLPRINDIDEVVAKIEAIPNLKHKTMLSLGLVGALRVSEVIKIKISDIDFVKKLILLRQAKGNKDRYIGISDKIIELVNNYIQEYEPKEYLFEGQTGGQYSTRSCEEIYHKYIDTETSWHNLRHTMASFMVEQGTNQLALQAFLGHNSPKNICYLLPRFAKILTADPNANIKSNYLLVSC